MLITGVIKLFNTKTQRSIARFKLQGEVQVAEVDCVTALVFVVVDCLAVFTVEWPLWRKQIFLVNTLKSMLNRVVCLLFYEGPTLPICDTLAFGAEMLVVAEAGETGRSGNMNKDN